MNAYDLYEFFIEAKDLQGKPWRVKVQDAYVKETFNPGTKKKEPKIILRLVGRQKVLGLNKTRTGKMIEITGTPEFEKWAGTEIIIKPGKQSNQDTVVIEAPTDKGPTITVEQPKNQPAQIVTGARLQAIIEKAKEDSLVAFSDLRKAAGLDSAQTQDILRECGGDYDEAFKKIATQYAEVIG